MSPHRPPVQSGGAPPQLPARREEPRPSTRGALEVQLRSPQEESEPVRLARLAIETYIRDGRRLKPEEIECVTLKEPAPVFVSLKKWGDLRGCVGTLVAACDSAAEEIVNNAISAATEDPRFWPVRPEELPDLDISVDVLNPPERVADLSALDPGKYGVIVRGGLRVGLLLPAIEGIETPEEQFVIACRKAGLCPDEPDLEVYRFTVTRYH